MKTTICVLAAALFLAAPARAQEYPMDSLPEVPSISIRGNHLEFDPYPEKFLPEAVKTYLLHVKQEKFESLDNNGTYSGMYLEKNKKGACDEFALNALMHLKSSKSVYNLQLIAFSEYQSMVDQISCEGSHCESTRDTDVPAHAIVIYQSDDGRWHGLGNGYSLGIDTSNPDQLVREKARVGLTFPKSIRYIPVEKIPEEMLTGKEEKNHWPELKKLMKEYKFKNQ